VPQGMGTSNINKVLHVMESMGDYGIAAADAIMFVQALKTKLMQKRHNIFELIIDSISKWL
jgi:hypothetical protein